MMRILFPYMARWHAVNWTRYHSLLHALADMGHEVHVLQPPPLESLETNYQEVKAHPHERIVLHDVSIPGFLWRRRVPLDKLAKKALYCLAAMRVARRLISSRSFDVLLLYNIPQFPLSRLRVPLMVFDYADDYIDMLKQELGAFSNRPTLRLARLLLTGMMKRAGLVLSVSRELADSVPVSMKVVPNGVESAALDRPAGSPSCDVKSHGKPVVGFIGSFEYFIDFDAILDAARLCPEFHFLLVGTGRDFHRVTDMARDMGLSNLQLTGGVPHDEVFDYIQAMDLCLNIFKPLPVSHRACPIKLFEYWSQKKPVISTRLQELSHIDRGWLYYADSPRELAATIRSALENPEELRARASSACAAVRREYTWERIAELFLEQVGGVSHRRDACRSAFGGEGAHSRSS